MIRVTTSRRKTPMIDVTKLLTHSKYIAMQNSQLAVDASAAASCRYESHPIMSTPCSSSHLSISLFPP
jgi:hypothetical protein